MLDHIGQESAQLGGCARGKARVSGEDKDSRSAPKLFRMSQNKKCLLGSCMDVTLATS
jgi:hypothetical protein